MFLICHPSSFKWFCVVILLFQFKEVANKNISLPDFIFKVYTFVSFVPII